MGSASLITRVCCEAVRSAILATAWLLVMPSWQEIMRQVTTDYGAHTLTGTKNWNTKYTKNRYLVHKYQAGKRRLLTRAYDCIA